MRFTEILIISIITSVFFVYCENDHLLEEGKILFENEKYDLAIQRFDSQLMHIPDGEIARECKAMVCLSYRDWIREEIKFMRFDGALELMRMLISRFPESSEAEWARNQQAQVQFNAALEVLEQGIIPEGSRRLREFLAMYPDDSHADEAKQALDGVGVIAFVKDSGIWISMADGSGARNAVKKGINPNLSVDGKQLAYIKIKESKSTTGQLYASDIGGKNAKRLRKSPIAFRPRWSFDSKKIAVSKDDFFQILDMGSKKVSTFRPDELGYSGEFDSFGDWSRDGKTLICYLNETAKDEYYICRVDISLDRAFKLATEKSPIRDIDWSFDDKIIAYSNSGGLFLMDSKGANRMTLIDKEINGLDVYSLSWAPSGKSILFVASDEEGKFSLYVINIKKELLPIVFRGMDDSGIQPLGCSWAMGNLPS